MACGAEMRLVQAIPDNTMMVAGYEHQTWQCTGCDEVERRLMFTRVKTPIENVPLPAALRQDEPARDEQGDSVQGESVQGESVQDAQGEEAPPGPISAAVPSAWARAVARIRGKHTD
jgi:hypothetical protein